MPRGHDLDAVVAAISPRTALVHLANPNNPTGTWFGADAFAAFMARVPESVIVVVDEAYAEFADAPDYASALALQPRHPNLVVTRTFSKAHALAGLRVGYAVAHPDCIAVLERVRESFNVNAAGLAAAVASLGDEAHLRWSLARNAEQRAAPGRCAARARWLRAPVADQFLLVEFGSEASRIEVGLLRQGVVLRPMAGYGLPDCLRITVGDASENRRLLSALAQSSASRASSALQERAHERLDRRAERRCMAKSPCPATSRCRTARSCSAPSPKARRASMAFLEGEDTAPPPRSSRGWVRIEAPSDGVRIVHGVGLHGLQAPSGPLDCGNAGTAMRLLAGLLAAQRFDSVLVGDESLSKRPMRRVIEPLATMGAVIDSNHGHAPLRIRGGQALRGVDCTLPVASAQLKSALLLAGLYANGDTVVREPHPTRDYTERMLAAFGADIEAAPGIARLRGGRTLRAISIRVPADFSSAAFFLVAATLVPGSNWCCATSA